MASEDGGRASAGRPRDTTIDEAVLDATLRRLARDGFAGLSLAAVAAEAGTSRPAIYRRWPDKVSLVVDAIARLAQVAPPDAGGNPFEDLVAELEHFRHCITEAAALPLAGLMLGDEVDDTLRAKYRDLVVAPRRARIRACLQRAIDQGAIDADADLTIAASFLTGSWYALALAGNDPPDDWARRTAALVWRACGGRPDRHAAAASTAGPSRPA
ncbi:MAG: TetR family transcriptional regulator [Acidimicrobiia bacterium]|nr:MAG: TetR family transcriptional regulator [Acidimicrobiia bacterium]